MTALILTFLASFVGAALLIREGGRLDFRPWPVIGGFLLLVCGAAGFAAVLIRWAVS